MIRFYHTADIHFGVENYGKTDPKTGIHTRLLDFNKSFGECIDQAIAENIDLFLLCGDAYKTAYPTPTQQKMLMGQLLRLYAAGIPVAIIVGNHDHPLSFGKANALEIFAALPVEGFVVFSRPSAQTIATKNGPVQVVGIPWPARNTIITHEMHRLKDHGEIARHLSEQVGIIIGSLAATLDPNIPSILAGHLTVSNGIFSGSEKCAVFGNDPLFLPSQLAIEPFDYVALGHLHRHQNLNTLGGAPVVYAGSIERVDFGERKENKGFCKVTITQGDLGKRTCSFAFQEVATRPMIQIEVTLTEQGSQTEQILAALRSYNLTDAIIKIVYHLAEAQQDTVDLASVQQAVSQAHYLVGIFPIHKIVARTNRASVAQSMDFTTLVQRYFETKPELTGQKELLLAKALQLEEGLSLEDAGEHEAANQL